MPDYAFSSRNTAAVSSLVLIAPIMRTATLPELISDNALAFGLAIVAAAYGLGAISGAHLNPAVSLGMALAGRMGFWQLCGL